ncbi:MAG TPA: integrase [Pusillimonas sp.]|nr:integrase [Pusillimonas sp.]
MAKIRLSGSKARDFTCPPGQVQAFLWDTDAPGLGVRATSGGVRYIFQGRFNNQTVRVTIGNVATWHLDKARAEARRLRTLIDQGRDPRVIKAESQAADAEKRENAKQAKLAQAEAKKYTLEKLLTAYSNHLEKQGRQSYKDARSIFKLHVFEAWPQQAQAAASALTPEQVADMMRKLFDAGKGRTANKLRSYVRAAFQVAKDSRFDARVPVAFKAFGVTINPAAETVPDGTKNRSGKNPLSHDELITYWKLIKHAPGIQGAVLRLHLLTGGQRIAQLVRVRSSDVTADTITLYDNKGRPGKGARPHLLPLMPEAKKSLTQALSGGDYALSTNGGETPISTTTLANWASDIVGDKIPGFTSKRIRSGVETLLAKHGVGKDVRGRLQSHGISGVQDRSYDGHDYLPEKKKALMVLFRALEQDPATVTQLRSGAA